MRAFLLLLCFFCISLRGQTVAIDATSTPPVPTIPVGLRFDTVPAFPLDGNPLVIHRAARANQPFSVTGQRGAILGQQDGTFELWLLPVKVLHDARLSARMQGYDADINLNDYASDVEVRPDHTTITYAHAAMTVRQHMFIPRDATPGLSAAVVLFEVHAARPVTLTLSFTPSMERQWPAPNFGRPGGSWIRVGSGGAFSLETDNPSFFGMVAMPQAQHGPVRPYQERPQTQPLSFQFAYDPAHDDGRFFPLIAAVSDASVSVPAVLAPAARYALLIKLVQKAASLQASYRSTADNFDHFFDTRLTVDTPDPRFNEALRWAEIAIEQSKVATADGAGLAAGWFTSGDSARPGFGWFFGRDTLWTLYAVNRYGDFDLSRQAMDFLLSHQRADGKMMHEYSQTADTVDWASLPYPYASADSTPLFVMAMEDYVRTSGDVGYLKQHWDNVKRAYAFTRAHTTNGVYDNVQGSGWIEEWLPKKPYQEIYLAALDGQSSDAMGRLALLMNDSLLSSAAKSTAEMIRGRLADFRGTNGMYAFSRNADGTFDTVPTIFPSVAWWSGRLALPDAEPMLSAWAGHTFSTDWGTRSVPTTARIYDPVSYHIGSVWPLYTGWVSMAEFRAGHSLAATQHLMQNVNLTWLQDPGAVTELLSGFAYEPLGRSSSHQLWSSAMVLSPAIGGMFGLQPDALQHTLVVAPQLPANWDAATVHNLRIGSDRFDVTFTRTHGVLQVDALSQEPTTLCLTRSTKEESACKATPQTHHRLTVPLPAVEAVLPPEAAREGGQTEGLKVLAQKADDRSLTLVFDVPAGRSWNIRLRRNTDVKTLTVTGAEAREDGFVLHGPETSMASADTYKTATVQVHW